MVYLINIDHRAADQAITRILRQPSRPPKVRASRGVWGHVPPRNIWISWNSDKLFPAFWGVFQQEINLTATSSWKSNQLIFLDWSNRSLQPCCFAIFFSPPNTGAGYFSPQFVSAGIFFVQNSLEGKCFPKSPPPPTPQRLNGRPRYGKAILCYKYCNINIIINTQRNIQ
jgi:hypothetical protein